MYIIMPNGKVRAQIVQCILTLTRLINAKLIAAPTGLFAHNCQHRGIRINHISHLPQVHQTGC